MADDKISSDKNLGIVDLIVIVLRWKKFIFISTGFVGIIAVILYFFVFPLIYLSTATVKGSGKSGGLFNALEQLSSLGSFEDLSIGGKSKELATYTEILGSRRCLEPLIIKYDLMNKEEYRFMEDAIKGVMKEKLFIDENKVAGLLTVGVFDKDPQLAKEMTEFLIAELDKINIEISITQAKNNREFIEKRYIQAREDLSKAEDTLKAFQLIYGVAPDLQVKASAQSVFTLEADLKAEEVKLDVIKKILSADQPEVKVQEAKISSLRSKIAEIQTSTDISELIRLGNSPQIVMAYLRLQREIEIQTKILTFMLPVYEQAKIEEKRETPTIIIMEKPYVSERKVKPKRLTMVILSMFGTFSILSIGVILYETSLKKLASTISKKK